MKKQRQKIWGFLVVVVIFFFIGRLLYQNWNEISALEFKANPLLLTVSFCLMVISSFLFASGWFIIINRLDENIKYRRSIKIYFLTNLAKYIPGKLWNYMGQVHLSSKEGAAKRNVSISIIITILIQYLSGITIFLLFYSLYEQYVLFPIKMVLLLLIPFFLFALHPRVLEKGANCILDRLHYERINVSLYFHELIILLLFWGIIWTVYGAAHFFLLQSFCPVPQPHLFMLTACLAGASIMGGVLSFIPAGLGVTEGVLIFLLSPYLPLSIAVVFSLLSRLWRTLNDICCAVLAMKF